MLVVHALLHLELPYIHSLKGRRAIIASIKDRLKRFNMAVADLSGEYPKEALIALLFFATDRDEIERKISKIEEILARFGGEIEYDIEYQII